VYLIFDAYFLKLYKKMNKNIQAYLVPATLACDKIKEAYPLSYAIKSNK